MKGEAEAKLQEGSAQERLRNAAPPAFGRVKYEQHTAGHFWTSSNAFFLEIFGLELKIAQKLDTPKQTKTEFPDIVTTHNQIAFVKQVLHPSLGAFSHSAGTARAQRQLLR